MRAASVEAGEGARNVMRTAVVWHCSLPDDTLRQIHAKVGLPRHVNGDELRHWLWEAARCYEVRALPGLRWQVAINRMRKMEKHARAILVQLNRWPDGTEDRMCGQLNCWPDATEGRTRGPMEKIVAMFSAWADQIEREAKVRRSYFGRHASHGNALRNHADCILIGGDLPLIFSILYGRGRKGEAPGGHARDRFVAAACNALGLMAPTPYMMTKHRTCYLKLPRKDVEAVTMLPPRHRMEAVSKVRAAPRREAEAQCTSLPAPADPLHSG